MHFTAASDNEMCSGRVVETLEEYLAALPCHPRKVEGDITAPLIPRRAIVRSYLHTSDFPGRRCYPPTHILEVLHGMNFGYSMRHVRF